VKVVSFINQNDALSPLFTKVTTSADVNFWPKVSMLQQQMQ
jgi:hypothetical protein